MSTATGIWRGGRKAHVVLEGSPPHVNWLRPIFHGRWLAHLHIRLHPELGENKET